MWNSSTKNGSQTENTTIPLDVVDFNIDNGNGNEPSSGVFTVFGSGIFDLSYEVRADGSYGTYHIGVHLWVVNSVVISD